MLEKSWLKYGLILGIVSIVLMVIKYYIFSYGTLIAVIMSFGIMIGLAVVAAREEKAAQEGFLTYGEALITVFLTLLTGTIISSVFMLVVSNWVDPGLKDKLIEEGLNASKSMMEAFGAPADAVAEGMEKAEEQMKGSFSVGGQLMSIFTNAIMMFIFSAIIAIFVKKVRPEENYL